MSKGDSANPFHLRSFITSVIITVVFSVIIAIVISFFIKDQQVLSNIGLASSIATFIGLLFAIYTYYKTIVPYLEADKLERELSTF